MDKIIDGLALVVAGCALFFSIITYKITLGREKRKEYYEDFFKEFLMKLIPNAISEIKFVNGKFEDHSDFTNTVSIEFTNKIRPLKYLEKDLYKRVQEQMSIIEEIFVENHNIAMSKPLFDKKVKKIEEEVAVLYSKTKRK